jgi:1,2-diacylglycerol 3-alpha-glucosyltransferase
MKIGIFTNTYPPVINGVSVAVESLKKQLENLGHQVFIACPEVKGLDLDSDQIFYIRSTKVPDQISPDLNVPFLYIQQATKFFRDKQIDIIHSHDTIMGGAETTMIALNLGIPAVHTFHTHVETYNYFPFPGYKAFIRRYFKDVLNNYNHIITPSQKMYNYLLDLAVKVPISQVLNIPNLEPLQIPVDDKYISKIQALGVEKDDFVFLSFCRLAIEKGVENSILLLLPVLQSNPKVKLLIAGGGPYQQDLKDLVIQKGLSKQVLFYGAYHRSEISSLASISKVFVFTSYSDNLPTNIFEAMYFGLPVLSVDDMSVDYLLQEGQNGYKLEGKEFTDKAQELIDNPVLLEQLSTKAKNAASQIKPQDVANEHIDIYEYCIKNYNNLEQIPSRIQEMKDNTTQIVASGYSQLRKYYTGFTENIGFPFK